MEPTFDFVQYTVILLRRKKILFVNFVLVSIAAFIYAFFIAKKQFEATVTFLPPVSETRSISTLLSGFDLTGVFGSDIMPEQIMTIFYSQALRRRVIDEFNLYEKYKLKNRPGRFRIALKRLEKDLELECDEVGKMGISRFVSYTIRAYHTSPDTSFLMVNYVFGCIDSAVREVSIDRGRRDRIFAQQQLAQNKAALDSIQDAFRRFQLANKAYNIPEQVGAALKNYSQIRASIIANEIQIRRMQDDFRNNYPSIVALKKSNAVMNRMLDSLEKQASPDILVGLEISTELAPQYANFIRDIEVQNELILLMSQELEQAKLKEARDVSPLKIIDPPYVPEYKARPKRILLIAVIVIVYMTVLCFAVILQHLYVTRFRGSRTFHEIAGAIGSGR